jgi:hypothetical protein
LYLISKTDGDSRRKLSKSPLGLVVGTDLRVNDYLNLNIEGRFVDETALNTGITVRY